MEIQSSDHETPDTSSVPPPPPSDGAQRQDHAVLPQSPEHPYVCLPSLVVRFTLRNRSFHHTRLLVCLLITLNQSVYMLVS